MIQTNIIINFQFEALHCWPSCPETHTEYYLRYPHRHIFHIEMKVPVTHTDRDIEFIQFKRNVLGFLQKEYKKEKDKIYDIGSYSCEMLCGLLMERFGCIYVKVMEDNENGAEMFKPQV